MYAMTNLINIKKNKCIDIPRAYILKIYILISNYLKYTNIVTDTC